MPQVCLSTFDTSANGGFAVQNLATRNAILQFAALYQNTDTGKMDTITEIRVEVPTGSTLAQLRAAVTTALVAKGAEYGYTVPRTNVLMPALQFGQ